MITPYERLVEFSISPKANYRCLELSPNGTMIAAVTVNSVEIWSYQSNVTLLAECKQNRPTGYSKALLNRVFVVWNQESDKIAVIRSEGIADFYAIAFKQKVLEDVYEDQYSPICYCSASIKKVCSISIEQYGYPISTCTINDRIIIASDSNYIIELKWNGDVVGCPLSRFIPSSLLKTEQQLQNTSIISVSGCSYLSCLAIALDCNQCFLLTLPSSSTLPVASTVVPLAIQDGIRQILFCPGLPLLAVTSSRLSIDFYQITPSPSQSNELNASHYHSIDIRQYPQVNSSPLYAYDSIVSMCWSPGQSYIAIGLKYQGFMVWSVEGEMIFAYNPQPLSTSNDDSLSNTLEVSCCCFSLDSTRLLFSIPYDEVRQDSQENLITIPSHLYCQQFVTTSDVIHSMENCSFFGHTSSSLIHLSSASGTTLAVLPSVYSIPSSFVSQNEYIRGMEVSPTGRNVLLFTPSSLCIFMSSRGKWSTVTNFISNSYITACVWITDYIFLLAASPKASGKAGAVIYAFNMNFLNLSEAIQEIEVNFSNAPSYHPSLQSLLPTSFPSSSFPFIQSMHCSDSSLLCGTSTGHFYLFSISACLEEFTAITKQLPIEFVSKGDIHSVFPLRNALFVSTQREVLLESGETREITCSDILALYWDQSLSLLHLTEDAEPDHLFNHIQQLVLCDHQDRGVIHNPMNLDTFIIFISNNQQIAWFPSYERVPSCCLSETSTLIPSQTNSGIWGFSWRKCALISLLHCGDDAMLTEEKNWLQPLVVCCYHLLIAELLHANQPAVASAYLQLGVSLKLPGFTSSLEYLLHYSLNNNNSSFLAVCLQLLSQLPYYSRLLVRCLRKQERSMWPFAVQRTEDIIELFHTFLFTNDMEYSITTISILQGLVCNASQTREVTTAKSVPIKIWRKNIQSEEDWLFDDYEEIFTEDIKGDCTAHITGLQLLLVCILRGQFSLLPDVYRFLTMEEARHQEGKKALHHDYAVNEVLSWVCYMLFKKGHLASLYSVMKAVQFDWTIDSSQMHIPNYADYLDVLLEGTHWEMITKEEEESSTLNVQPCGESSMSEEDMNDLLRSLMLAGFAEWSLLLLLFLLKTKQLTNFALARNDIWTRCIHDFKASSNIKMKEFLTMIQQEVEKRRDEL